MANFDQLKFIEKLVALGQRQGKAETKAADLIIKTLEDCGIGYSVHNFETKIPLVKKSVLLADGKKVACKGSSFIGGEISGRDSLISSLIPSRFNLSCPNINFNPESKYISLSNFYFAPAVAISASSIGKILKAKKIVAHVVVEPLIHQSRNILAGNANNPQNVVFAHYDSIERGATDNASGVAVLMNIAVSYPEIMKNSLLVFAGNEELSYDQPTYWGHGFRVLEKDRKDILDRAKKIIAVDCVGNGKNVFVQDDNFNYLVFPVKNLPKWKKKVFAMYGDLPKMTNVYHSEADGLDQIEKKYLEEAVVILTDVLRR